jgi:hypothetical protein
MIVGEARVWCLLIRICRLATRGVAEPFIGDYVLRAVAVIVGVSLHYTPQSILHRDATPRRRSSRVINEPFARTAGTREESLKPVKGIVSVAGIDASVV